MSRSRPPRDWPCWSVRTAELISAAERDDIRLYGAATKAGWSADELRKIGFDAPAKTRRVARKRATATRSSNGADGADGAGPASGS